MAVEYSDSEVLKDASLDASVNYTQELVELLKLQPLNPFERFEFKASVSTPRDEQD